MNNCLVTKLKASVNDDKLEKLGIVFINFNAIASPTQDTQYISVGFASKVTFTCVGGSLYKTYGGTSIGSSYTLQDSDWDSATQSYFFSGYISNTGCYLEVPKYELKRFSGYNSTVAPLYITDFEYTQLTSYIGRYWAGTLSDIPTRATVVNFNGSTNVSGKLSDISHLVNVTTVDLGNTQIIPEALYSLGTLVNLIRLQAFATGSIEDFVAAQRSNGRTSCNGITCNYLSTEVTFNGSAIANKDQVTLSWTASTITYDGVTITA